MRPESGRRFGVPRLVAIADLPTGSGRSPTAAPVSCRVSARVIDPLQPEPLTDRIQAGRCRQKKSRRGSAALAGGELVQ